MYSFVSGFFCSILGLMISKKHLIYPFYFDGHYAIKNVPVNALDHTCLMVNICIDFVGVYLGAGRLEDICMFTIRICSHTDF